MVLTLLVWSHPTNQLHLLWEGSEHSLKKEREPQTLPAINVTALLKLLLHQSKSHS